ncbi:hypothetical protein MWN33_03880 [Starkeya koreensis]|uniref:DUF2244 domain-containing protein n=1 Tax=Ancylobacter koreensis TaxID=266121 RepID=A0ABT0DIR7_9HYPH|nr:hypothetical protein [Ancylobacter koreensis]MCK0207168.1 hypothetical protein [Ancylobacter koreensis]
MSSTDPFDRIRFTVRRVSWWQIAIVVAVALALGTALALVAASVFLVVFPIVVIAGLAYRVFGGRKRATGAGGPTVIEAEYRVLSPEEAARADAERWDKDRRLR